MKVYSRAFAFACALVGTIAQTAIGSAATPTSFHALTSVRLIPQRTIIMRDFVKERFSAAYSRGVAVRVVRPQTVGTAGFTVSLPANSNLLSLGKGPDGNIWFGSANTATGQSGNINKLTTAGSLTTYPIANYHIPTSGGGYINYYINPNYITSRTGDSLVWFSSYNGIGAVTTSGALSTFFVTANGSGTVTNYVFSGITSDANGNLWLLGNYNNVQTLYKFVPSTQSLTPYTISTTPSGNQYNFVGPAIVFTGKYIAFAQPSNDTIWLVNPTTATPSTLSLNISGYTTIDLSYGTDGNLYWAEDPISGTSTTNALCRLTVSTGSGNCPYVTSTTAVGYSAQGTTGYLWFFNASANVNSINESTNAIASYAQPPSTTIHGWITTGSDANIYYISANSSVTKFLTH